MILSDDDLRMAARGFFTPAQLLDFISLPDDDSRASWGAKVFEERGAEFSQRRQPGEPDAGALTIWTPAPEGFRYAVEAATGQPRAGCATWNQVYALIGERLTVTRLLALREVVEKVVAHEATYLPGPVPYATSDIWRTQFYEPWSCRSSALQLQAASALLSILPGAVEQPALF